MKTILLYITLVVFLYVFICLALLAYTVYKVNKKINELSELFTNEMVKIKLFQSKEKREKCKERKRKSKKG
jgi:hypothetical protein